MSLKNFGAYSEFSSVAFSKHWWGPQGMVIRWYWPFFVVIWWYSPKNVSDVVISEKWGDILISREKIGDIMILPWLWWWYGDIPYRTKFRRIKLTNFGGQWRIFCPQKNFVRRKFCPTKKFVRRIFFSDILKILELLLSKIRGLEFLHFLWLSFSFISRNEISQFYRGTTGSSSVLCKEQATFLIFILSRMIK